MNREYLKRGRNGFPVFVPCKMYRQVAGSNGASDLGSFTLLQAGREGERLDYRRAVHDELNLPPGRLPLAARHIAGVKTGIRRGVQA